MADVTALFASRKSKKGKKKKKSKAKNATQLMEQAQATAVPEVEEEVEEGVLELGGELDQGNWVDSDDEEDQNKTTSFLMSATTKEIADLDIEEYNRQLKGEKVKEETSDFQWSQKKEEEEAAPEEEVAPEVPEKEEPQEPQVYRPRQLMASRAKASGDQILKQLDNEEFFPTLGGAAPKPAANAWGVAASKPKKPKAVYLGEDFIAAMQSEGEKPGYRFGPGENGSGYYWEGPARTREKALKKAELEKKAQDPAPPTKTEPESKPEPEKIEETPAVAQTETSESGGFESSADRFADLAKIKKKKKKKKKKTAEE